MPRVMVAAAWSVLAVLLFSKPAVAVQPARLILNPKDSSNLMARMNSQPTREKYRGQHFSTKRFSTSDNAIRITCSHNMGRGASRPILCSITLDPSRSVAKVTSIDPGYVAKSSIFRILSKKDVAAVMANIDTPFSSSELISVKDSKGSSVSFSRFVIQCPRDWVFDVVACEGHLVTR